MNARYHARSAHQRRGMALMIVLIIASVLMVSVLFLYKSGRQYKHQMSKAIFDLQAQYLAIGAIQHAELKVRYFPTELYDASEYSLGKNPYFDFTELDSTEYDALDPIRKAEYAISEPHIHKAGPFNEGPRFLSSGVLSADNYARWFQLQSLDPLDSDPANFASYAGNWFGKDGWPKEEDGVTLVRNSDLYLWKFRYDISNRNTIQPSLRLARTVGTDFKLFNAATDIGSPYDGMYEVTKLRVLSVAGQRRLNEEAVNFTVVATIWDPQTNQPYQQSQEKVLKVKRR